MEDGGALEVVPSGRVVKGVFGISAFRHSSIS